MAGIGAALRARRKPLMTQIEFGERLGLTQASVSAWEREESTPNAEQLVKAAAVLGCSIEDLVVGVDKDYDRLCSTRRPHTVDGSVDGMTETSRARQEQTLGDITAAKARDLLTRTQRHAEEDLATARQINAVIESFADPLGQLNAIAERIARRHAAVARAHRATGDQNRPQARARRRPPRRQKTPA